MEQVLCTQCQKKLVAVKKWGLCISCYNRMKATSNRNKKPFDQLIKSEQDVIYGIHQSEIIFIQNFLGGKKWYYEPAKFYVIDSWYIPDFYEIERNVFIEVIGTNQAFETNKHKYIAFKKLYPNIKLEIRKFDTCEIVEIEETIL